MTAEEYSTPIRPILGDKNFTLDEKMKFVEQTMERYHQAKVKNSRLHGVSVTPENELDLYLKWCNENCTKALSDGIALSIENYKKVNSR